MVGLFIWSELFDGISFVQAGDKITRWEGPTLIHVQGWIWWVIYDPSICWCTLHVHCRLFAIPRCFFLFSVRSFLTCIFSWSSQEVRAVERRILLETLANQLPADAIRFSSRLATIARTETGETLLQLDDGTRLLAKVSYSTFNWKEQYWIWDIIENTSLSLYIYNETSIRAFLDYPALKDSLFLCFYW